MPLVTRMTARIYCFLIFLLFAATAPAQMPTENQAIEEVFVIAHKVPREINNIAASITALSEAQISDTLSTSLADALRYTPGVDHESGSSRFGVEGISIRGIGGNRVAMLLDGVPLSDQFDVGSFSNATRDFINAGLIDRIEILHGPASALYGSAAIGGVITALTPDPLGFLHDRVAGGNVSQLYRGSDNSNHTIGMLALGQENRGVLFAGSLRHGKETEAAGVDNPLDLRDYERKSLLAKWVADDRWGNRWQAGFIQQDSETQSDLNSMLGTGRFRSTTALRGDDESLMQLYNVSYDFGSPDKWFDAAVIRAYYLDSESKQLTLDERGLATRPVSIDRTFSYMQETKGLELNLHKSVSGYLGEHNIGFGVEYRIRDTQEYRDALETGIDDGVQTNVLLGEVFPLRDFPISSTTEWGAYLEDAITLANWTVIAALRADSYSLNPEVDQIYREDFPFSTPVSLDESDISPKLGLIYHLADSAEVYLQYAQGFRAPPFEDANIGLEVPLFNIRAIPNPDLKSENSKGLDLGFRWRGVHSNISLSLFHTNYTDFIESKRRIGIDPVSGRQLFQSQNLARTKIEGAEGRWSYQFSNALQGFAVDGAFYLARGENKENGEPLNSVGPDQLVLGFSWLPLNYDVSARLQTTFTHRWKRRDETAGELFQSPGYATVDLYLTQAFSRTLTARLGVMNLSDRVYWRWSDVGGLSPDDPVIPYLAQAGRSVSVSLNKRWQ